MNPETTPSTHSLEKTPSHGYASSGSESRKPLDSGKKRASRAGTRSVTSLSAAQLERKRANDREAQRAIRQRTKDHIDGLEKNINDLRLAQDADKRALAATQQRNRELEEEVTYLRGRLTDAGFSVPASHAENQRQRDTAYIPPSVGSPAARTNDSAESASAKHSVSSAAASQPPGSRQGSWQHHGAYPSSAAGAPLSMPGPGQPPAAQNLTQWRSHDQVQPEGVQWSAPAHSYQYQVSPGHQRTQPFQHSPQHHQQSYASQPQAGSGYPPAAPQSQQQPPPPQAHTQPPPQSQAPAHPHAAPPQPQSSYHSTQLPQAEFQNMAVSSPGHYQMPQQPIPPQQHTFGQPGQYQVTPMQVPQLSSGYGQPQGQIQYQHQGQTEQQSYPPQQPQAPMEYRDAKIPPYPYGQYPT
ncbi:hypothetical protein MBLNU230_g7729t1 [Neophaeotheca triangularis]